ncbi:MAG TPA: PPOX class F420-dependent oxidoreductase [Rubrobacteraceae bacterium]|nr:PPOX class F420-dependent oxidoreductase [Rubrobacteraceae bacterium]
MTTENGRAKIPADYKDLLESTALAHVATLGPDGEPQNNPVWFDWDGEHLKFSQTKARQKYRNVGRDPRIALSIVDPENPYRYLEVRGEVVHIEEDPDLDFINAMAKKYLDQDKYPFHQPGDERVVIHIEPRHTTQMGA